MVVFDTAVVDLSDDLQDPVDLLFGTQLGGGTDINRALAYCQQVITRPAQTILVLITDLYEGGNEREMLRRAAELAASGVQVVCLLALSDKGAPSFDTGNAAALAGMGIPQLRLHAGAVPRPDGRGDPEAGPRAVGGEERHRGRSRRRVDEIQRYHPGLL